MLNLEDPRLTLEAKTVLERLEQRYGQTIERLYRPECIILFGSYARGTQDKWSDVDLVIVSESYANVPLSRRRSTFLLDTGLLWDRELQVQAHCVTPDQFRRAAHRISILREAVRTGIVLLDRFGIVDGVAPVRA